MIPPKSQCAYTTFLEADYNRALIDRAQTYQRLASFQLYDIRSNLELITRAIKHNIELQLTLSEDESVDVTIESVVPAQVRIELDGIATLSRTYLSVHIPLNKLLTIL